MIEEFNIDSVEEKSEKKENGRGFNRWWRTKGCHFEKNVRALLAFKKFH